MTTALKKEYGITYGVTALFFLFAYLTTTNNQPTGPILFLPLIFLVYFILRTKRIIEAIFLGNFLLLTMTNGSLLKIFYAYADGLHATASNPSYQFVLIAGALIGGITGLMGASGSSKAVDLLVKNKIKSKKGMMVSSWFLSSLLFISEFLQLMIMGPILAPNGKKHRISKERMTYIIKSVGVPVAVLIPASVWGLFIISQLEVSGITNPGEGFSYFLKIIPLNFFPWISILVSFLVTIGIIPLVGKMKRAEELAEQGVFSEGIEPEKELVEETFEKGQEPKLINFILPVITLVTLIFAFNFNSVAAAIVTVAFTAVLYISQNLLTPQSVESHFLSGGIGGMATVFCAMMLGMFFSSGLTGMGFVDYLVELISKLGVSAALLPVLLFIVFSISETAIFLNWGFFIIIFPSIAPMAEAVGANPALCLAAVISATIVGSNTSFLSGSTILISPFTNTKITDHLTAGLPYQVLSFVLSVIAFLIAGFVLS